MKKLISVVLAICLLAMGLTFAAADEKIYNNGEAPELIKVTDAQGAAAAAVVKDAQGNVVAAIPEDELKIVYVGDRADAEQEIADLLDASLATLIDDKHIADAAWKVETDLFHVQIPEAYAGHLAEGGMVEMVFKPLIMSDVAELAVLTTVDGAAWAEAPSTTINGDGTISVGINEDCVVAFVMMHGSVVPVYATEPVPGEETNTNFTPSVSGKPDPTLEEIEVDGETGIAAIVKPDGTLVELITDLSYVVVTPLFERVYNPDVVTYEHLQWAYDTICAAPDLGGLANVGGEGTLADEINRRLEGAGLDCTDLTVSDLFDVTVYGDCAKQLQDGNRLEVTLKRNLRQDDIVMVLCAIDTEHWHVMDDACVTINADGTVTLSMEHPGVFALLVEADIAPEGAVTAP